MSVTIRNAVKDDMKNILDMIQVCIKFTTMIIQIESNGNIFTTIE